ncbi:MAG: acyl carrier protein [Lachnospiraceae bacterium]|jgi:acyl carrier protein
MEFEKLRAIIADVMNMDESEIKPETTFREDLGADSLDVFQIITGIEDEFGVEISEETAKSIETVQDAVDAIQKLRN